MQIKKFRSPLSVRLRGERKAHGTTLLAEPLHPIHEVSEKAFLPLGVL